MKVLLIQIDGKLPNLALMKLSQYHKDRGDIVVLEKYNRAPGWDIHNPDMVYISCIWKENRLGALDARDFYQQRGIKTIIGGSGVDLTTKLDPDIERLKPDYSLYPDNDKSMGFTTRGCIRKCGFCIVPKKEGKICKWQHPREFHNEDFNKITLLDSNGYAMKDWFFEVTDWYMEQGLKIAYNQGFDIRILTEEIAGRLADLKYYETLHFAFDGMEYEEKVVDGIQMLKDAGINIRSMVQFFVLVGYNTTKDEDKYRCRLLKELGTGAYVMRYKTTPWTKKIYRWANRKELFWSIDIDDYDRNPKPIIPEADSIMEFM